MTSFHVHPQSQHFPSWLNIQFHFDILSQLQFVHFHSFTIYMNTASGSFQFSYSSQHWNISHKPTAKCVSRVVFTFLHSTPSSLFICTQFWRIDRKMICSGIINIFCSGRYTASFSYELNNLYKIHIITLQTFNDDYVKRNWIDNYAHHFER